MGINISKEVLVLEKQGNYVYSMRGRYDPASREIHTRDKRIYVVPEDYQPLLVYRRRWLRTVAVPTYLVDEKGNFVKWSQSSMEASGINPKFLGTILNSDILEKLARTVYIRATDIISWLLAGLGLAFILVFFVFPLMHIHVEIGTNPVIVQPHVTVQQPHTNIPPAGNYTVKGGG